MAFFEFRLALAVDVIDVEFTAKGEDLLAVGFDGGNCGAASVAGVLKQKSDDQAPGVDVGAPRKRVGSDYRFQFCHGPEHYCRFEATFGFDGGFEFFVDFGEVDIFCAEDGIAALEVGNGVFEAQRTADASQFPHLERIAHPDVDASQESHDRFLANCRGRGAHSVHTLNGNRLARAVAGSAGDRTNSDNDADHNSSHQKASPYRAAERLVRLIRDGPHSVKGDLLRGDFVIGHGL